MPDGACKPDWRPAIYSALFALALYAVTLGGTYVFDDRYILLFDPRLGPPIHWKEFWTKDYFNGGIDNLYRPFVSMTYAVEIWLHGNGPERAWIFHGVNWLLHAAVSGMVAELSRRLTNNRVALIAGLLFAAHSIHVEAVANIVGRAELMCALGILGSMLLFLRKPLTTRRVIGIWCCFVLALLSKEQGMLLPLMLLACVPFRYDCCIEDVPEIIAATPSKFLSYAQPDTPRRFSQPALWLVLIVCWTLAVYVFLRENILPLKFWWNRDFLDWTINPIIRGSARDQRLMPFVILGRYAQLLVAPVRLSLDYGVDVINPSVRFSDPYLWTGVVVAFAWVVGAIVAILRRAWVTLLCLFGFAVFYGLVSNVVSLIGTIMNERLMYIPSIFVCILVAMAIARLKTPAMVIVTLVLLTLASIRTYTFAARWSHPRELFSQNLAEQPWSIRSHLLLAEYLEEQGDLKAAEDVMINARKLFPDYWRVWEWSARLALANDDLDLALQYVRRAARLHPMFRISSLAQDVMQRSATRPSTHPATTRSS